MIRRLSMNVLNSIRRLHRFSQIIAHLIRENPQVKSD